MKTFQPKEKEIKRGWHLIDAKDKVLGRLSTQIAKLLIGKHKPTYSAHMDSGDFVVVINAKEAVLTGNKSIKKIYRRHSGYPGGLKEISYQKMIAVNPEYVIEHAVLGMIPTNRLTKDRMGRLKVFVDNNHPYKDKFKKE